VFLTFLPNVQVFHAAHCYSFDGYLTPMHFYCLINAVVLEISKLDDILSLVFNYHQVDYSFWAAIVEFGI